MSELNPKPALRLRSLLRFSLRSVLVLIVLVALAANWWRLADRQREIVNELESRKISVTYDFQIPPQKRSPSTATWFHYKFDEAPKTSIRHWLAERMGPDVIGRVTHVDKDVYEFTQEELALIDKLGTVRTMHVDNLEGELDLSRFASLGDLYAVRFYAGPDDAKYASKCKQLRSLHLSGHVYDLAPLSALRKLRVFSFRPDMSTYQIPRSFDLTPLAGNRNLEELQCNGVSDISALKTLSRLRSLDVGDDVDDLSPIRHLTNLSELTVRGNISDLSPLTELNLRFLWLVNSKPNQSEIVDVECLRNMSDLESVYLTGFSNLRDLKGLSACEKLKKVRISPSLVSELDPLVQCPDLENLYIRQSKVSSLEPLAKCESLTRLDISGSSVANLEPLAALPKLRDFNAADCPVVDIRPLSRMNSLKSVNLANTKVHQIDRLPSSLIALVLDGIPATDFSGLGDVPELYRLSLAGTKIDDLSLLSNSKKLECLLLANTRVTDLTPLVPFKQLNALDLTNCPVSDISALAGMNNLEHVSLRGTLVTDLSPLDNRLSAELNYVDISHTRVSDLSPLTNWCNATGGYIYVFAKDVPTLSQQEIDAFEQSGCGEVFRSYGKDNVYAPWE